MPKFSPERRNFTLAAAAAATAAVLHPADTLAGLSQTAVTVPSPGQQASSAMDKLSPSAGPKWR